MNESKYHQPSEHEASIDRLASGELDDAGRQNLFEWLDADPRRWRRCALALLEARELEMALADWNAAVPRPAPTFPPTGRVGTAHRFDSRHVTAQAGHRRLGNVMALAASLLLAFGLGIGGRGLWMDQTPLVVQITPKDSAGDTGPGTSEEQLVVSEEQPIVNQPAPGPAIMPAAATKIGAADLISPYVRSVLERRGYEIESRHAVLPAVLPDGRRVMLPVDQFQLRYVGHRTS